MSWQKIPLGTRVRHRFNGYGGWIVGWTDYARSFEGHKTNPDGTQCRIYILGDLNRRYSAEEDLQTYDDISKTIEVAVFDKNPKVHISGNDFSKMPVPCDILTLGFYHARPLLRTSRAYRPGPLPVLGSTLHTTQSEDEKLTVNISCLKWYITGRILGGSEADDEIAYLVKRLDPILKRDFPIAVVPSHDPSTPNRGLIELARRLSTTGRTDASSCLVRSKPVTPQHKTSDRFDIHRHIDSNKVKDKSLINSKAVLLLDDIVTTGCSLMACKRLLLDSGACEVICLALGKAVQ